MNRINTRLFLADEGPGILDAGIQLSFSKMRDLFGTAYYVDGDLGSDSNTGLSPTKAKVTIQAAVTAAATANLLSLTGSVIYIKAKYMALGVTDPASYAETIIVPAAGGDRMCLIGVSNGRTQGGVPQIKKGAGSTALLTIRAPGCLIANLGFNGANSTGGGILLDDDGSTKTAFGTTIINCHFKNCVGSTLTDATTGGAIMWAAAGNAWQVHIKGCRFYKNVGDIVLLGTGGSVPQDVVIEDNIFSGPAASVDCNLYLAGGSGMNGVIIRGNVFGQLPSLGSVARYIVATGCIGMLVQNFFGCQTSGTGGTPLTFKVGGSGAEIPVTMHLAGNFGQSITADATGGEISIA